MMRHELFEVGSYDYSDPLHGFLQIFTVVSITTYLFLF